MFNIKSRLLSKLRRFKLIGLVALILGALIIFMNLKTALKYVIGAVIGAAITIIVYTFFVSPKTKIEYVCEQGYELRDTCIDNTLLCTLTTKDSINIYRIIREGLKIKETNSRPKLESVSKVDTVYTQKALLQRQYTKYLNNGVTEVWDTINVIGEILDWKRSHKTDEIIEVRDKITNNTAIIAKGSDDSETIRYIPTLDSRSQTWIGVEAGVIYDDDMVVPIGITLDRGKSTFGVYKDITTPFKTINGYGIKYKRDLIKVSTK